MEGKSDLTWGKAGSNALVLRIPGGFKASVEVPEDVIGIVRELSELRPGAVETEYLSPAGRSKRPRELRVLSTEKLQAAILALCERYGPLGDVETFRDSDGRAFRGEAFARWSEESRLVQRSVLLLRLLGLFKARRKLRWWEVLEADPAYELALYEEQIEPALEWMKEQSFESNEARRKRLVYTERRVREKAQQSTRASHTRTLRELVNAGMQRSGIGIALTGDRVPLELQRVASTLLARVWLRLAVAATAHTALTECRNCGKLLVPENGRVREQLRSDRETCSDRCRKQWSRKQGRRAMKRTDRKQAKEVANATEEKRA